VLPGVWSSPLGLADVHVDDDVRYRPGLWLRLQFPIQFRVAIPEDLFGLAPISRLEGFPDLLAISPGTLDVDRARRSRTVVLRLRAERALFRVTPDEPKHNERDLFLEVVNGL
jgi:hypothetical protein